MTKPSGILLLLAFFYAFQPAIISAFEGDPALSYDSQTSMPLVEELDTNEPSPWEPIGTQETSVNDEFNGYDSGPLTVTTDDSNVTDNLNVDAGEMIPAGNPGGGEEEKKPAVHPLKDFIEQLQNWAVKKDGKDVVTPEMAKKIKDAIRAWLGIPEGFEISLGYDRTGSAIINGNVQIFIENKDGNVVGVINSNISDPDKTTYALSSGSSTGIPVASANQLWNLLSKLRFADIATMSKPNRQVYSSGMLADGTLIVVTETLDYSKVKDKDLSLNLTVYIGQPGKMKPATITSITRLRDGGTTIIEGTTPDGKKFTLTIERLNAQPNYNGTDLPAIK
jgi:hypothetical protein